jgi:Mrp family chromosome partitioning ATPase
MPPKPVQTADLTSERVRQAGGVNGAAAPHLLTLAKAEHLAHLEPEAETALVTSRIRVHVGTEDRVWAGELAPLVARLLAGTLESKATVVYVTSVAQGDGASTVARQIAHTASRLVWCKCLLLDAHQGWEPQTGRSGRRLPGLLETYAVDGSLQAATVESANHSFHAAAIPPLPSPPEITALARFRPLLAAAYNLIVIDTPPVLAQPCFTGLSEARPRFVLVVQTRRTQISAALRAKQEIERTGAELFGTVLTRHKVLIPRLLDRLL